MYHKIFNFLFVCVLAVVSLAAGDLVGLKCWRVCVHVLEDVYEERSRDGGERQ